MSAAGAAPVTRRAEPALLAWAVAALGCSDGAGARADAGCGRAARRGGCEPADGEAAVLRVVPAAAGRPRRPRWPRWSRRRARAAGAAACSRRTSTARWPGAARRPDDGAAGHQPAAGGPPPPARFRGPGRAGRDDRRRPGAGAVAGAAGARRGRSRDVDFAALRRAAPTAAAAGRPREETLADSRPPERAPVLVHGDLWQGNTLWDGGRARPASSTGTARARAAGMRPGLAALRRGDDRGPRGRGRGPGRLRGAARPAGRRRRLLGRGRRAVHAAEVDWFTDAIRDQGRTDLDQPTLLAAATPSSAPPWTASSGGPAAGARRELASGGGQRGPSTCEAMSLSTRSSTALNGSLHRTVRWAWSLSLRCTQSTVKSRRFSWALRMNSPRSRARVVCGGTFLASKTRGSWATRSTWPLRSSR